MKQPYAYKLAQCDVSDENRKALESYRSKRLLWQSWIDDDEHHAIWQVLQGMVWQDVVFRSLIDLAVNDSDSALHNSLLTEALLGGHVATQILALRRLIDDGSTVLSLRRLLKDIKQNASLITRENFVCFDGLPYDCDKVREQELIAMAQKGGSGGFWAERTGPKAWSASEALHTQFDLMTDIDPANRRRGDTLPATVFKTVERSLLASGAEELADWSHVYLAHAGSPEARKGIAHLKVTSEKISQTTRALCRVTEAISLWILGISGRSAAVMPVAQFSPFAMLDHPVMKPEARDNAFELWHRLADERNAYLADITPALLRRPDAVL